MKKNLAIYIHWPFCQSKCPYCDFNSHVANAIDHDQWRAAYQHVLADYAQRMPGRRVTSIFFGGGTPSLMQAETVGVILDQIARQWTVAEDVEITLEANPGSSEAQKFAAFRQAGINRLSLGVQSLQDEALKFLGRKHDAKEARRAIELAAQNFPRFSFDLIYARKDQTLDAWQKELREALALADGHLSLYQLTIEPGTQFHTLHQRQTLTADEGEAASMYEATQEILDEAGLPAYEISNHARPGKESRHNLAYWHYDDYIGIGPGAHGRFRGQGSGIGDQVYCACEDHRAPEVWLEQVEKRGNGLKLCDPLDNLTAQREALMMGLRLASGIDHQTWQQKFGTPLVAEQNALLSSGKVTALIREGYLLNDAHNLRAYGGLQRLNSVLGFLAA